MTEEPPHPAEAEHEGSTCLLSEKPDRLLEERDRTCVVVLRGTDQVRHIRTGVVGATF